MMQSIQSPARKRGRHIAAVLIVIPVPTIRATVDGGYGTSQIGSYAEVGAGNRMIDLVVIRLAGWTGKLKPKAAQPLP